MNEFWASVSWRLSEFFFPERKRDPLWSLVARAILLLGVAVYSWPFFRMTMLQLTEEGGASKLHLVHLVIHEAGHVIFSFFGDFMHVLGGSLLQVLMPFLWFLAARFKSRDAFAGALCLWLMGQSLVDVSPYINDARSLQLQLLSGGTGREVEGHDWEYLLTQLNLLHKDVYIARWVLACGRMTMLASLVWGGAVLAVQYVRLNEPAEEET